MERSLARRAALGLVPVLAMLVLWMLARPVHADAGVNVLPGSPRIDTIRALVPRDGRSAGRLIVWVRVVHARGTPRGLARERPETVHTGRVVARVGDATRVAKEELDLDRRRIAVGYHLRFSKSETRAVAAGAGRRVSASVRMAQTIDLDSDGDSEDRARASTTRRVALARPAISIEPRDGYYTNGSGLDAIQVAGGHVVKFGFISASESPCGVGPVWDVSAPIDPETGLFSFTRVSPISPVTTTALGDFRDATTAVVQATVSRGGCDYRVVPSTFVFFLDD